jgi:hypothetical protein
VPTFLTRDRSLRVLAAAGYGVGLAALVLLVQANGGLAYDAHAYWQAGRNVLDGTPLYTQGVAVEALGAWKYPPLFAQIIAPFSLMPELVFDWLWRIVCFLCLRALVGSWRNLGVALLFPPVWNELSIANVTFPVAYLALLALRGRPTFLPIAIALKFGPALLVPFILLRRGVADRRRLLTGLAAFAGLCALSILVAPGAWRDYLGTIAPQAASSIGGAPAFVLGPSGAVDLALRGSLAVAATIIAIAFDEERLAWAAAVVTVPVLFFARLAPLVALFAWRPVARTFARPALIPAHVTAA